jgi:hypothetical protein
MDEDKYLQDLIEKLRSPKASIRYEACERLRGLPEITPEAIKALQEVVNDPDPEVSDAAKRALDVQLQPESTLETSTAPIVEPELVPSAPGRHLDWKEVWIKAITQPSVASFQEILDDPIASMTRGLIWIFIVGVIYALIAIAAFGYYMQQITLAYGANINLSSIPLIYIICGVLSIVVGLPLGIFLSAGVIHIISTIMGGQGDFDKLVYIVSSFTAPTLLITGVIAYIPIVKLLSYLISIYIIILYIISIMTVYKFSVGKAILTYFIPTIIGVILAACTFIFLFHQTQTLRLESASDK